MNAIASEIARSTQDGSRGRADTLIAMNAKKAARRVVELAKEHAKSDFKDDPTAARAKTDDEIHELASEGFWNVVHPDLENDGVDPEEEVDGMSIEKHYIEALKAAYRELRAR